MQGRSYAEMPLPPGWEEAKAADGKTFYIDHYSQRTSWVDPRDRDTKPYSFADCSKNELPLGWEQVYDEQLGIYYINHIHKLNQIEDPRLQWRHQQDEMLKDYLQSAERDLETKQEIVNIKQQRLQLAEAEYDHLNYHLSGSQSKTSLNSTSSTGSTKYDPDLLRAEVSNSKKRVAMLQDQLQQIQTELQYQQRGYETLAKVDEKMSVGQETVTYQVDDVKAIIDEVSSIKQSLIVGQKQKQDLCESLVRLKSELSGEEGSPHLHQLQSVDASSQTDLSSRILTNSRLAEKAKLRFQYEEVNRRICRIQKDLSNLETQTAPSHKEEDKNRLLLINEKEDLLRDLRSTNPRKRTKEEKQKLEEEKCKLAKEIYEAREEAQQVIGDRIRLEERKNQLMQELAEMTKMATHLQNQIKIVSITTLSSGSSKGSLAASSQGSLASSRGSLTSSFTDLYGSSHTKYLSDISVREMQRKLESLLPGCGIGSVKTNSITPIREVLTPTNTLDRNQNPHLSSQEGLASQGTPNTNISLSPRSSLNSLSPPASPSGGDVDNTLIETGAVPPPSYKDHVVQRLKSEISNLDTNISSSSQVVDDLESSLSNMHVGQRDVCNSHSAFLYGLGNRDTNSQISYLANGKGVLGLDLESRIDNGVEFATDTYGNTQINMPLSPICENAPDLPAQENSTSAAGTQSVSAAVSNESVAGDSGVYEAATRRHELDLGIENHLDGTQMQILFNYNTMEGRLYISLEKIVNLQGLGLHESSAVFLKGDLTPCPPSQNCSFQTGVLVDLSQGVVGVTICKDIPSSILANLTLHLLAFSHNEKNEEECLGVAQIPLSPFSTSLQPWITWCNIINCRRLRTSETSKPQSTPNLTFTSNHPRLCASEMDISRLYSCTNHRRASVGAVDHTQLDASAHIKQQRNLTSLSVHSVNIPMTSGFNHLDPRVRNYSRSLQSLNGVKIDKEINTDMSGPEIARQLQPGMRPRSIQDLRTPTTVTRSKTFSANPGTHYICQLNRSDSDSAMPLYRKPFTRNSIDRRSIRWKKSKILEPRPVGANVVYQKTSLDLEMDLQASRVKQFMLNEEIDKLREIKRCMEEAKMKGEVSMPTSVSNNNIMKRLLDDAEMEVLRRHQSHEEMQQAKKSDRLMKKTIQGAHQMAKNSSSQGDITMFREKLEFFTATEGHVLPQKY
ncbi:protein KIBRA-like isoform X2 [Anneissia japonica]|uniref:protein KIBRA-like isoform X2 n=1 Tax=Anneissia japonica TaxID=1529436 RepID=UPI00142591A1|nr:protein KIBRA-like isoform X2 [Anneissia japonica]